MDTLTDLIELLILNARNRASVYAAVTREIIETSPTCDQVESGIWTVEQAEVFLLADQLKDRLETMVDDIQLVVDDNFPKFPGVLRGQEDDPHEERTVIIQALARSAFEDVDFHEMARTLLARVKEGGLP